MIYRHEKKVLVENNTEGTNDEFNANDCSSNVEELGYKEKDLTKPTLGFEGMNPEELYGFSPDLGLIRSEDLNKGSYSDFFRDPKIMEKFTEYFDMTDRRTRNGIMSLDEADQSSVLTALTSKLYDNIVTKVDDIDYGDIPSTKGDITKLPNYNKLRECIELLRSILKEFKQDPAPIDVLAESLSNMVNHKDLFERAFRFNCELPIIMYNNMALSIINGVSYMIATCIEFMKTPNQDNFQIVLDKISYSKTKNHMIYKNLQKLNKSFSSGDFDKAMNHIIDHRVKGLSEAAIGAVAAVGVTVALVLNIIPILRELVFLIYYSRMRVSDFFDIQADLLQMNAHNLEINSAVNNEEAEKIASKQLKIVGWFRKAANKISFTTKKAEVEANKDIVNSSKKMKLNDLKSDVPESVSALF